jgi:hypothetical protein
MAMKCGKLPCLVYDYYTLNYMVLCWNYIITGKEDISDQRGEKYCITASRLFLSLGAYLWNLRAQIKIERIWGIYYL